MIVSGFSVAAVTDWILITMGVSYQVARNESEIILGVAMMKQIIKHVNNRKSISSTENTKENTSDMAWPGGQKFSGYIG